MRYILLDIPPEMLSLAEKQQIALDVELSNAYKDKWGVWFI